MNIVEYFEPGLTSIEEVIDKYGRPQDATTLQKVADCPRKHFTRVEQNLRRTGYSVKMIAGIVLHDALEYYYAHPAPGPEIEETAVQILLDGYDSWGIDRGQMDPKETHISKDHLENVLRNYFHYWNHEAIEIYSPVSVLRMDDLDLSDVIAAKFLTTESGLIILGESNLIMRFDVDGEDFIYSGKPDLPVRKQAGTLCIMDHKTTSSYLSDWWAKSYEVSNKMRGYMAMVWKLLGERPSVAVINGIYVGKYATNPNSKATKFQRFEYNFTEKHLHEAIKNQYMWAKTIDFYREQGYFPQGCAFGGCSQPDICKTDPDERPLIIHDNYEEDDREFWDL